MWLILISYMEYNVFLAKNTQKNNNNTIFYMQDEQANDNV